MHTCGKAAELGNDAIHLRHAVCCPKVSAFLRMAVASKPQVDLSCMRLMHLY